VNVTLSEIQEGSFEKLTNDLARGGYGLKKDLKDQPQKAQDVIIAGKNGLKVENVYYPTSTIADTRKRTPEVRVTQWIIEIDKGNFVVFNCLADATEFARKDKEMFEPILDSIKFR
jgi:hypothetical protein